MKDAIVVRVSAEIGGRQASMYWIVATSDPAEAVRAVKERVEPDCTIELIDTPVSRQTIRKMGLTPGQAWPL